MERLEINPEKTMQQVKEKIQDIGGIIPCNASLTNISVSLRRCVRRKRYLFTFSR